MSYILLIIITSLILLIAAVLVIAISSNFRMGLRIRNELTQRIKFLRLDKMLQKRNIKREHYLHTESVTSIENQIRNCEACSVIKQCDESLEESSTADLSFCPNHEDFESIAKKE